MRVKPISSAFPDLTPKNSATLANLPVVPFARRVFTVQNQVLARVFAAMTVIVVMGYGVSLSCLQQVHWAYAKMVLPRPLVAVLALLVGAAQSAVQTTVMQVTVTKITCRKSSIKKRLNMEGPAW